MAPHLTIKIKNEIIKLALNGKKIPYISRKEEKI